MIKRAKLSAFGVLFNVLGRLSLFNDIWHLMYDEVRCTWWPIQEQMPFAANDVFYFIFHAVACLFSTSKVRKEHKWPSRLLLGKKIFFLLRKKDCNIGFSVQAFIRSPFVKKCYV